MILFSSPTKLLQEDIGPSAESNNFYQGDKFFRVAGVRTKNGFYTIHYTKKNCLVKPFKMDEWRVK